MSTNIARLSFRYACHSRYILVVPATCHRAPIPHSLVHTGLRSVETRAVRGQKRGIKMSGLTSLLLPRSLGSFHCASTSQIRYTRIERLPLTRRCLNSYFARSPWQLSHASPFSDRPRFRTTSMMAATTQTSTTDIAWAVNCVAAAGLMPTIPRSSTCLTGGGVARLRLYAAYHLEGRVARIPLFGNFFR